HSNSAEFPECRRAALNGLEVTRRKETRTVPSTRSALHRVLVCAGVCLCLPIILCLVHGLSSEVKPQPLPRTLSIYREQQQPAPRPPPRCPVPQKPSTRSDKAVPESIQKKEVVYGNISQHALGQPGASGEPEPTAAYSFLVS
uniref:Uncharacterized protein n=1 Tax=Gasterosteus aculeatus aculeatus TaxID=481459 RepID=A0AAQ4S670_GASAC